MESKVMMLVAMVTLASLVLMATAQAGCSGPSCFNPGWKKDAGEYYEDESRDLLLEKERELELRKALLNLLIPDVDFRERRNPMKSRNAEDKRRGLGSRIITLKKSADN